MLKKTYTYRAIVIVLIGILAIIRLSKEDPLYPNGDAVEYTITTEALYNHFTPDVRSADFDSFKKAYCKENSWETNKKFAYYDEVQKYIAQKNQKKLDYDYRFFTDKDGKQYSVHFFFYSLINIPSKIICSIIGFNPLFIYPLTNLVLLLITCILLFKYSPFDEFKTAAFIFLFFFSTNYWYLSWQHPEVATVCFSTLGLWLFLSKRYYWGLFLISLAALQNQPIAIVVAGLSLYTLFTNGINIKNILRIGISTFIILVPSLFYYYHFGETNLIKYQGALDYNYVTANRIIGFFFDINQGAILAIPFVLISYLFLLIRKIVQLKESKPILDIIIATSMIGTICISATIYDWNHGQSVVLRYVTYISAFILVHFFYLVMSLQKEIIKKGIVYLSIITQIATIYYHATLTKYDWDTNTPKPLSNWFFENHPRWYNPDNVIFISRYFPELASKPEASPFYYMKEDGTITKLLIHKKYLNNLEQVGLSKNVIDSIGAILKYNNNWAYINVDYNFIAMTSPLKLQQFISRNKIYSKIKEIKSTPEWYDIIKKQALSENISEDIALKKNAAFVLNLDLNFVYDSTLTKEKMVLNKMSEIKAVPKWLKEIEVKAKEKNITLDSAIYLDALWIVENDK